MKKMIRSHRQGWVAAVFLLAGMAQAPGSSLAAWVVVSSEPGKRVEVERDSIETGSAGQVTARGRVVLDKPIVDPRTSASYRIIEVLNRFDCTGRTYVTLKRTYFREENDLVRQEEVRSAFELPVRSGTPDDRMMREVCRPAGVAVPAQPVARTLDKVNALAADLRPANEAMIEKSVKAELARGGKTPPAASARSKPPAASVTAFAPAPTAERARAPMPTASVSWAYEGAGGPQFWGRLRPEYASCERGARQSPIDLREGIAVDLEVPQFEYRSVAFRVVDTGRWLQVTPYGGTVTLLGRSYSLDHVRLVRPSEHTIDGRRYPLEVQMQHRTEDGALAVVSVLFSAGVENPFVQAALNDLPLERHGSVMPPGRVINPGDLLPASRAYFTLMGSLSTPPCTEEVLWLVMKEAPTVSVEQLAILQRLYAPNARPVQPANGRIIKESR